MKYFNSFNDLYTNNTQQSFSVFNEVQEDGDSFVVSVLGTPFAVVHFEDEELAEEIRWNIALQPDELQEAYYEGEQAFDSPFSLRTLFSFLNSPLVDAPYYYATSERLSANEIDDIIGECWGVADKYLNEIDNVVINYGDGNEGYVPLNRNEAEELARRFDMIGRDYAHYKGQE